VRDHQHGEVMFAHELTDDIRHLADDLGVDRRYHFVEKHHLWPHR
jgi:hypothetical protein